MSTHQLEHGHTGIGSQLLKLRVFLIGKPYLQDAFFSVSCGQTSQRSPWAQHITEVSLVIENYCTNRGQFGYRKFLYVKRII